MPDTGVEVIVPWRGGCPHREAALAWLIKRMPYPVRIAQGGDPWRKGAALAPAIEASGAEIVVVSDADVWTEGLGAAVMEARVAGWAVPHMKVRRLAPDATEAVLAGAELAGQPIEERPYLGIAGGGIVVAAREKLLEVPMDPRFGGWGQEDESWGIALRSIFGAPWRGSADLYHLWHPPPQRKTRTRGSVESWALRRRYVLAKHDQRRMRALIEEGRSALAAHQQAMHADAQASVG